MEYETFQRSNDWVAHIKGHTELWECGATEEEAVEKLRVTRGNLTKRVADGLCPNCGKDYFVEETIVEGELRCSCARR